MDEGAMAVLFCDDRACRGHEGLQVQRAAVPGEIAFWIVAGAEQRFVESSVSPLCPFCGQPLLWPPERLEGVAPTTPEEAERLSPWAEALGGL